MEEEEQQISVTYNCSKRGRRHHLQLGSPCLLRLGVKELFLIDGYIVSSKYGCELRQETTGAEDEKVSKIFCLQVSCTPHDENVHLYLDFREV